MISKKRLNQLEEAVSTIERITEELQIQYENNKGAYTEKLRQMTVERYQNAK